MVTMLQPGPDPLEPLQHSLLLLNQRLFHHLPSIRFFTHFYTTCHPRIVI